MNETYCGYQVILDVRVTEAGPSCQVRRSWRERLCSWPWRPFTATRWVITQVPARGVVQAGNVLLVHPETWQRLKRML